MTDIDSLIDSIYNGTTDLSGYNQSEHAGICSAGPLLIGALIVCDNARKSLGASCNAAGCQRAPANWQIDEEQERQVQQWAETKDVWVPEAEKWLASNYGEMIAQGAEAIALHNMLFPETIMKVVGFTRDEDGLFRIILTQPYISCKRLATKQEIDEMVATKGFRDNGDGKGVNYVSDRLCLEDMHPANVFVEELTGKPICIDCIVKFLS